MWSKVVYGCVGSVVSCGKVWLLCGCVGVVIVWLCWYGMLVFGIWYVGNWIFQTTKFGNNDYLTLWWLVVVCDGSKEKKRPEQQQQQVRGYGDGKRADVRREDGVGDGYHLLLHIVCLDTSTISCGQLQYSYLPSQPRRARYTRDKRWIDEEMYERMNTGNAIVPLVRCALLRLSCGNVYTSLHLHKE
jgi:hypothetical protein